MIRVAEWLALQTSTLGDPGSIPAKVKTFFDEIRNFKQYNVCRF